MPALATIHAGATGPGSISPNTDVTGAPGFNQAYTITADSGAIIHDVLVDGVSVGAVTGYTFNNVQADHAIEAQFIADFTTTQDFINAICDGLVIALKAINGSAGGYQNDFSGAVIERNPTMSNWTSTSRAYIGVGFEEISEQLCYGGGANEQWRAAGTFKIRFITSAAGAVVTREAPERMAASYAQDIMRAIALNHQLYDILATGICSPGSVVIAQDPDTAAQVAYGEVTMQAEWVWHI